MTKSDKPTAKRKATRDRKDPSDRRDQFVQEAIKLFSKFGFGANTRLLAAEMGTAQALLFRYFPKKELLVEAVQNKLRRRHSRADLMGIISDRKKDIRDRVLNLAERYIETVYDRDWIRLYMYSGLADGSFNRSYIATVTDPLLKSIAAEVRHFYGVAEPSDPAILKSEHEFLWMFHGGIYYQSIRRSIYGMRVDKATTHAAIELSVDSMLWGMRQLYAIEATPVAKI